MDNTLQNLGFTFDVTRVHIAQTALQFKPDVARALFMAERMRVDFVYNTIALEGNPFTYPEVKTLIDGVTVGGHKPADAEQVLNLNRALTHVVTLVKAGEFSIDAATACGIQGIVARGEALKWGTFRDGRVSIGGTSYKPPEAQALPQLFEIGASYLHSESDDILRAFCAFLWGSLRQFFYDGNKRTSRFLANGTLLAAGYPPLTIFAKDQLHYNQVMTRFYDSQDATEALLWLYEYYQLAHTGYGFDKT